MKCPNCTDSFLTMSDRQGVEIDYCAKCRGIWLDRGELDKLLERSSQDPRKSSAAIPLSRRHADFEDSDFHGQQRNYPIRRKSWLHEIFD